MSKSILPLRQRPLTVNELRNLLLSFCEKHRIRKLEVFGSVAQGRPSYGSDVDLLVTLNSAVETREEPQKRVETTNGH